MPQYLDVIIRRYYRSIHNFCTRYMNVADNWFLRDNSEEISSLIAEKTQDEPLNIIQPALWQSINMETENEPKF